MKYEALVVSESQLMTRVTVNAANEIAARRQLETQDKRVLSLTRRETNNPWRQRFKQHFQHLLFCQELLALLKAGLNLIEALETLTIKEKQPRLHQAMDTIYKGIQAGKPFSEALSSGSEPFPNVLVALVSASERSGNIPQALERFIAYRTQFDQVKTRIFNALIYPCVLLVAGLLVTLFLICYVVPRFSMVYEDTRLTIPMLSSVLIQLGRFMINHDMALLLMVGAAICFGYSWLLQSANRDHLLKWISQLPGLRDKFEMYQLARLYRTLGMLLNAGLPIRQSLDLVHPLMPPALRTRLMTASQAILAGTPLSQAMEVQNMATPVAIRMLRVGEKTGQMGNMMENIAVFHDELLYRWIGWFVRLFEPIIMLIIGLTTGVIVILMYIPIFDLAGAIN